MYRIRICDPAALEMDGQWLVEYDPARPGVSPEEVHVVVSPNHEDARTFADSGLAVEYWRQKGRGWDDDGDPRRPLTQFCVEFIGDDDDDEGTHYHARGTGADDSRFGRY